jgi:ribosome-associated protein
VVKKGSNKQDVTKLEPEAILERIADTLEDKKALDVQSYDLRNQEAIADFMIVATGTSKIHLRSLKDHLQDELREIGLKRRAAIGQQDSNWYVLDYYEYIIHLMGAEERDYYKLEALWQGAGVVYY